MRIAEFSRTYGVEVEDLLDKCDGRIYPITPNIKKLFDYILDQIHDALELYSGPIVEVHLSDVANREEWRRVSVIADLAASRVVGKGPDGYREALEFIVKRVGAKP